MGEHERNWYQRLNLSLQDEESRLNALTEIKNHFASVSQNRLSEDAAQLQLPLLFDCLNNANPEQVDLACEVLTICMSNLTVGETTERYSDSLVRSLNHPNVGVKLMALKEIERCTLNDTLIKQICEQPLLLTALFNCISDDNLLVANKASDIIISIGKNEIGLSKLLQKNYIEIINQGIRDSDIIRFRIYSIVVQIACTSAPSLQAMINFGWINLLIKEISASDILLQLNALELLSNLAATSYGRVYIEGLGILESLSRRLGQDVFDDLNSSLLLPGLLKFFGNIAYWDPAAVFATYPNFPSMLLQTTNFEDPSLFGITIDTIGHIASTTRGKIVLNELDHQMKDIISYLGRRIINLPTEKQVRTFGCFENLLRIPTNEPNSTAMLISQKWYSYIEENPMNLFFKYARIPFPELRLASLNCLQALSEQTWGQEIMLKTASLPEFLLDRSEENTKETKDIKYLIIKCLSRSESKALEPFRVLFEQFIKDGPYYSSIQTQVAIEGNAPN